MLAGGMQGRLAVEYGGEIVRQREAQQCGARPVLGITTPLAKSGFRNGTRAS